MVARTLGEIGHLDALGASFARMANAALRRWPDLAPMLYYPAFQ
jgi:hypothetical protein